ncbi:MAG: hypothetical protein NTV80_11455 [Verrucomicrobia bacterium]|nr:hypothetical protein [Verrucomicrobiota bacterium]
MIELGARGDELAKSDDSGSAAIAVFREALDIVPEPKEQYLVTTWLLAAIGDTAFLDGDLEIAAKAFQDIGRCDGWLDNAFIWLRRGQVAYENGDLKLASQGLASAFMLGGYDIFDSVDDKYPAFVLSQMRPPVPAVHHRLAVFHMNEEDCSDTEATEEPSLDADALKRPWWKVW